MDKAKYTLKTTLSESGYSLTDPREQIFSALQLHGPLSVAAITRFLNADVDKATVYRTIELYERLGIVNRMWHGFKSTVELSEIFMPHHHHAQCQQCGATIDLTSEHLERAVTAIAKDHGFMTLQHVIELQGYCKNCQ